MKHILFASAAALIAATSFSSFVGHKATSGPVWIPAANQGRGEGFVAVSDVSTLAGYDKTDVLSGQPTYPSSSEFACNTKSSFVCAAEFNTDGSGNITTIAKTSFGTPIYQTGEYNY